MKPQAQEGFDLDLDFNCDVLYVFGGVTLILSPILITLFLDSGSWKVALVGFLIAMTAPLAGLACEVTRCAKDCWVPALWRWTRHRIG